MARKSPQSFVKKQKEMERMRKAKEKMARRHHEKKDDEAIEIDAPGTPSEVIAEEA